jgi:hypothetical protein
VEEEEDSCRSRRQPTNDYRWEEEVSDPKTDSEPSAHVEEEEEEETVARDKLDSPPVGSGVEEEEDVADSQNGRADLKPIVSEVEEEDVAEPQDRKSPPVCDGPEEEEDAGDRTEVAGWQRDSAGSYASQSPSDGEAERLDDGSEVDLADIDDLAPE